MLGKIVGFVIGSILFGIGATVAEYGIKKAEKKFAEFQKKSKSEDANTAAIPIPTN
jgi:hypothetical protein